jgi:hypothetical protein
VYARELEGRVLTLGLMGELWQDNMVLYDNETWSRWSQLTGEAKTGPLQGKRLRPLPSVLTDWQSWRRQYPDGTALALPRSSEEFQHGFYRNLEDFVLSIAEGEEAKTWPLDLLNRTPAVNDQWQGQPVVALFERQQVAARLYRRTLEGRVLTFASEGNRLRDRETGSTWEAGTGRALAGPLLGKQLDCLPASVCFRQAWLRFHPASE